MKLNKNLLFILSASLLLMTQTAHADFRKALDALQQQNGSKMLDEVKDAVSNKNDDGIILFLSILKQYPNTWRPTLNEYQQAELFNNLEKASSQSSLQAQYRLAVIPRKENNPPFIPPSSEKDRDSWYEARKQEKLKEHQDEITRLEPVANKGYAPAALHLYGSYAHNLTKSKGDIKNAMKWLRKSAELGSVEGQFSLGMKLLNIIDDAYGCYSNEPNLCLPKDEVEGWGWLQEAAMKANNRNIASLGLFSHEMGNLYLQGGAGNKPDLEQAYLWYLMASHHEGYALKELGEIQKTGQMKILNPALNEVWNDTEKRVSMLKHTIKNSKLPKLFASDLVSKQQKLPVFSYTNKSYLINQTLDVYADGSVNLLISSTTIDIQNNQERWIKISPQRVNEFLTKLNGLYLDNWTSHGSLLCEQNCLDFSQIQVTVNEKPFFLDAILFSYMTKSDYKYHHYHPKFPQLLALIEEYFPMRQLMCNADSRESKTQCEQVRANIVNLPRQGECK